MGEIKLPRSRSGLADIHLTPNRHLFSMWWESGVIASLNAEILAAADGYKRVDLSDKRVFGKHVLVANPLAPATDEDKQEYIRYRAFAETNVLGALGPVLFSRKVGIVFEDDDIEDKTAALEGHPDFDEDVPEVDSGEYLCGYSQDHDIEMLDETTQHWICRVCGAEAWSENEEHRDIDGD